MSRSPLRTAGLAVAVLCAAALSGCDCAPTVADSMRFACQSDGDCADGFSCVDTGTGKECVKQPGTGGGQGGGAQGGGAGGGGGSTIPPDRLGFATPPRTAYTGGCSDAVTIETRDPMGVASAVPADTVLSIASAPAGLGFFAASDCTGTVLSQVTVAGGTSSSTVYFSGMSAGDYDVTVSASGFIEATQTETLATPPDTLAFTTTPPSPLLSGMCLLTTVEARTGSVATPLIADTPVGLTSSVADGTRFYSDSECTSTITSSTIGAGSATTSFFIKPLTGTMQTLSATASFATATQDIDPRPVVRTGNCGFSGPTTLADGGVVNDTSDYCSFSPPLGDVNHAFIIVQGSGSNGNPSNVEIRCYLNTPTQVRCLRYGGGGGMGYHFQVAELPRHATVQAFGRGGCPALGTDEVLPLSPAVDPAKSFVLKEVISSGGVFDDEDGAIASLPDGGVVVLSNGDCNGYTLQVVEWTALDVTTGELDGGMPPGTSRAVVSGLPPASTNTALLIQPHSPLTAGQGTGDPTSLCNITVRGELTGPSEVTFTRGGASVDAGCDLDPVDPIHSERIDFGANAKVQQLTETLAAGEGSRDVTVNPVDTTRTVVFTSSQLTMGQGAGESDYDSPGTWVMGDATVRTELTGSTTVHLRRDRSSGAVTVTFYVVELDP